MSITVYVPDATPAPITNVPGVVIVPAPITHAVGEDTRPAVRDVRVQLVDPVSNPDPLMLILVPAAPSSGEALIEGTEKDACAKSFARLLDTVIKYAPGVGLVTTTKVPSTLPLPLGVILHVLEASKAAGPLDVIVHVVAVVPKPVPVTETVVPAPPAVGASVIAAAALT